MTDRTLPHACAVSNRVHSALIHSGHAVLADQLAAVHRATCDLVQALHAEREAGTDEARAQAQRRQQHALACLRDGRPTGGDPRFTEPDVPSPRYVHRLLDTTRAIHHRAELDTAD